MRYLLGIDIGTSGAKALLVSADTAEIVASSVEAYELSTPTPLWAEQSPGDWWQAVIASVSNVLNASKIDAAEIKGIGLSGQMHGSVFLDENGSVLRPAILWCDQRTQAECDWIMDTVGRERTIELTSNPILTGFTAGKIIWTRNHEPEVYSRVKKVLLPKDYIRFRLTGEFATEVSDASGTGLFDVKRREWSWEMLDARALRSEVAEGTRRLGRWAMEWSKMGLFHRPSARPA